MGDPMGFMNSLLGGGAGAGKGNPGGMRQRDLRRQQRLAKKKGRK